MADFVKECKILEQLRSKYIVSIFGASISNTEICVVLEYCPLGSLADVIKKNKNELTPELKKAICIDTAKGMEYLHSNGIVHRDLKPGNILCYSLSPMSPVVCK